VILADALTSFSSSSTDLSNKRSTTGLPLLMQGEFFFELPSERIFAASLHLGSAHPPLLPPCG